MDNPNLIVVKCPQCGLRLSFKPIPNYRQKQVTCPRCHFAEVAGKYIIVHDPARNDGQPSAAQAQPKPSPTPSAAPGATETDSTRMPSQTKVTIKCTDTGQEFPLKPGPNTIGRKSSNPKASITFIDLDTYMSRLHATITVVMSPNGVQLQMRDENSANGTFVNGIRVPERSVVRIMPGTPFRMGQLNFVCSVSEGAHTPKMPPKYEPGDTML